MQADVSVHYCLGLDAQSYRSLKGPYSSQHYERMDSLSWPRRLAYKLPAFRSRSIAKENKPVLGSLLVNEIPSQKERQMEVPAIGVSLERGVKGSTSQGPQL